MKIMRLKFLPILGFLLLFFFYPSFLSSQTISFKGMLFSWLTANFSGKTEGQIGIRYLPELSFTKSLSDSSSLDAELSLSAYGTSLFRPDKETQTDSEVDLYRLWLRYASSQFEVRVGLQKINFGSASIFRPLMWFDRLDPRDPLGIEDLERYI